MPSPALDLGLLLDVDGPIASPVTRTIAIASIVDDLVTLTAAGVPVAFITGRSDEFVRERVIAPLLSAGLDDALAVPGARMFCVFEKGAAWAPVTATGIGAVTVDDSVRVPAEFAATVRELHAREFAQSMFWDDTKRAMVSVEQRTDVSAEQFYPEQQRFNEAVFAAATTSGLGMSLGDRVAPDATGSCGWRIDATVISIDIEAVSLDKDRGAERAIDYFARLGALPSVWRSVGDSRSDYKMADHVHSLGLEVAHVDVRPAEGVLERPYRVITEGDLVNDHAGAAFLAYWRAKLPR